MKKLFYLILGLFITIILSASVQAEMMLFVQDGCPHCALVQKYFSENDIYQKLDVSEYEISNDESGLELFRQTVEELGYEELRTPFLADGSLYFVGDTPIISYVSTLETTEKSAEPLSDTPETLSKEEAKDLRKAIANSGGDAIGPNQYLGLAVLILLISILLFRIYKRFR